MLYVVAWKEMVKNVWLPAFETTGELQNWSLAIIFWSMLASALDFPSALDHLGRLPKRKANGSFE